MRNALLIIFAVLAALLTAPGCSKNNSPSPPEEALILSTDADLYTITPGPSFDFNLTIESAIPAAGVKIEFVVKGETDNHQYLVGPTIETSNKTTRIFLSNLPQQIICLCIISVRSKSKSTNFATTSFRIVHK